MAMPKLPNTILGLLAHSWSDIDFKYERLTKTERDLITKDDFDQVVSQINMSRIYVLYTEHDTQDKSVDGDWTKSSPTSAEVSDLRPGRPLVPCVENGAFVIRATGTHQEMSMLLDMYNSYTDFSAFLDTLKKMGF